MIRPILLFLCAASLFAACSPTPMQGSTEALLHELDQTIARQKQYIDDYQHRLDSLKDRLEFPALAAHERFALLHRLGNLYNAYQSTLSIRYHKLSLDCAREHGDRNMLLTAKASLVMSYSLCGQLYNAERVSDHISDTLDLSPAAMTEYYKAQSRKNRELYRITTLSQEERERYLRLNRYYAKKAMESATGGFDRAYHKYMYLRLCKRWDEAAAVCDRLLDSLPDHTHEYAMMAIHKADIEYRLGHTEESLQWAVRSAIADIHSATRDHGSLNQVSEELFNRGEVKRAMNYIRLSINDTRLFNSQSRSLRDIKIMPKIESAYHERNSRLQQTYVVLIAVSLFSLGVLGVAMLYVTRQNRKLAEAQRSLQESNLRLNELTRELRNTNRNLHLQNIYMGDANRIKEAYIGKYLQNISGYICKLSDTYKHVNKMLRDGKTAELKKEYSHSNIHNDELKEFYTLFDRSFTELFPSFVKDMNGLLLPEAQFETRHPDALTTVLRIFALIRLGITDSTTIASLLQCSIRTVYNYRSQTRLNARPEIGDFEQQVRLLGINHEEESPSA